MREIRPPTRRMFLYDLGRGMAAVAAMGFAACASGDSGTPAAGTGGVPSTAAGGAPASGSGSTRAEGAITPAAAGAVSWQQVSLGIVSAYILARDGEAAVVDTGVAGSAGDIAAALTAAGLGWDAVGHVILTHRHRDHIGSLPEVLANAPGATPYAGEADIQAISSPRPITAVHDGDEVFGLRVIATPGHTAGHISILDPVGGLLVAGDALNGGGGGVLGPNPDFSDDIATAIQSVRKLAGLQYDAVLFGHGDPVEDAAAAQVAALAEEL